MQLVTVQQAYYTLYWGVASASLQRDQDAANYLTRVLFKGVVHRKESYFHDLMQFFFINSYYAPKMMTKLEKWYDWIIESISSLKKGNLCHLYRYN